MTLKIHSIIIFLFLSVVGFTQNSNDATHDFSLELEGEYSIFFEKGAFTNQERHFPSIAISPEYSISWNKGYDEFNVEGFARWDRDKQRTHVDLRELYYQRARGKWEFGIGLKKIYWGVIESNHLVDIINQTDQVESFDGEQKLGQPMIQFSYITDGVGTFDFFYLPYQRKRVFAGEKGRFRFAQVIDGDLLNYESSNEEWHPSFAVRWSHYIGDMDLGLSQFYGTGREPLFVFNPDNTITAFYPEIFQTGLDLQYTKNAFLWKLEAIYRYAEAQDFFAVAAGVEYTFGNVNGRGLDIGALAEYSFDSRDELSISALQNDVFYGSRIALNDANDSAFLIGGITDFSNGSTILSMEGSRRVGDSNKISLEARLFTKISDKELLLSNFRDDSFLKATWGFFF
jgi:hypothetical protein